MNSSSCNSNIRCTTRPRDSHLTSVRNQKCYVNRRWLNDLVLTFDEVNNLTHVTDQGSYDFVWSFKTSCGCSWTPWQPGADPRVENPCSTLLFQEMNVSCIKLLDTSVRLVNFVHVSNVTISLQFSFHHFSCALSVSLHNSLSRLLYSLLSSSLLLCLSFYLSSIFKHFCCYPWLGFFWYPMLCLAPSTPLQFFDMLYQLKLMLNGFYCTSHVIGTRRYIHRMWCVRCVRTNL